MRVGISAMAVLVAALLGLLAYRVFLTPSSTPSSTPSATSSAAQPSSPPAPDASISVIGRQLANSPAQKKPTTAPLIEEQAPSKIFDQEAKTISPRELGDAFESGERRVEPDAETAEAIRAAGKPILYPVFKVCVASSGDVSEVSVIVTSGFPVYDEAMMEAIRAWRYTPFSDPSDGKIAVCSSLVLAQVIH